MCAYVNLRSNLRSLLILRPRQIRSISQNCGKSLFQKQRSDQVHPVQCILSAWKVVQMTQASLVIQVRTLPHFPERAFHERKLRAGSQFSATLGGDIFTSVRLQDTNSCATNSSRPLLPLWPISCVCRLSIPTSVSTVVVFAHI